MRGWMPVAAGLIGALAGGWLAGRFLGLGLVLIAESGLAVTWGLLRDDGQQARPAREPGERTLVDVLSDYRNVQ